MENFLSIFREVQPRTMTDQTKCFHLYTCAKSVQSKDGAIAEIGVCCGGSGKLLARSSPHKVVHLFDTFTGIPEHTPGIDVFGVGAFPTNVEDVKAFLSGCSNVEFHVGVFPTTSLVVANERFCFVHIDTDNYKSILECLLFFYPRMVSGGIMMIDDYDYPHCPGVRKATTEFLEGKPDFSMPIHQYQFVIVKV